MTTSIIVNPVDEVVTHIHAALSDWKSKNTPETIKATVTKQLDKAADEVLYKLLGFDFRYSKWDVDHCNGRSGESAAGDYLRKHKQTAIEEWFKSAELPPMSAALKKALQKEASEYYKHALMERVRVHATTQASNDAAAIIAALVPSKTIDSYLQVLKLVYPDHQKME